MCPIWNRLATLLFALAVAAVAAILAIGQVRDAEAARRDLADVARVTKNMKTRLVAKLVPNPHNQTATGPGFCVDRAWFRDPLTADQGEEIMMSAQLPSHPDIEFLTILSAGNKPASQSLLERSADTDARLILAERWRISNLRAAPRRIAGITGDEVVTRYAEMNDTVGFSFWWEVNGTEDNVLVPHFVFQMSTGKGEPSPVPTSLSQEAAMALWDKISSSIRFHSPDPKKLARPAPPPPKA